MSNQVVIHQIQILYCDRERWQSEDRSSVLGGEFAFDQCLLPAGRRLGRYTGLQSGISILNP